MMILPNDDSRTLAGVRVLVVEDEYYLADDLARALEKSGATVVGPVGTVAEAEGLIDQGEFDRAVLDMNLRGNMAFCIADRLQQAGIPFIIATGYDAGSLPDRLANLPRIEKPFHGDRLIGLLASLPRH